MKNTRIEVRVSKVEKRNLTRAAKIKGMTLSVFLLSCAEQEAWYVLMQQPHSPKRKRK